MSEKMKIIDIHQVAITDCGISDIEFQAVKVEAQKQIDKWGVQTRTPFEWAVYTGEECGELQQAIADNYYGRNFDENAVIKEAIQTATLCLKIAAMYRKLRDEEVSHE